MTADRREVEGASRPADRSSGVDLRATHRGVLVLQTENARRMMRRLRRFKPGSEPATEGGDAPGTAPAGT
jgi:hypothetical protein